MLIRRQKEQCSPSERCYFTWLFILYYSLYMLTQHLALSCTPDSVCSYEVCNIRIHVICKVQNNYVKLCRLTGA